MGVKYQSLSDSVQMVSKFPPVRMILKKDSLLHLNPNNLYLSSLSSLSHLKLTPSKGVPGSNPGGTTPFDGVNFK